MGRYRAVIHDMSKQVHRRLMLIAARVAPPLRPALLRVGVVTAPVRGRRSLAHFLARAVVGQQLSTAAARSIWTRVESEVKSRNSAIPEYFCARNAVALRRCGLSEAKVRALIAIREAQENGKLSVRRLRRLPHSERSAELQQIWGIGQWTADMVSIFYFGDPDVWPEGDVGVYRGLETIIGKRSKRTVLKIASAFSPYRSYLALYMWRVLDQPQAAKQRAVSRQPV